MPELFEPTTSAGFARVAVERGVDRFPEGLTYAVPGELADLAPGERVLVPLGKTDAPTSGYVIERIEVAGIDTGRIKPIARRARGPKLPGQLLALARWISSYYCAPIGTTLAAITPAAVKRQVGMVSRTLVDLAGIPLSPSEKGAVPLPSGQRRVLEA
jgi:primosomal protein N' (replication factor Y)